MRPSPLSTSVPSQNVSPTPSRRGSETDASSVSEGELSEGDKLATWAMHCLDLNKAEGCAAVGFTSLEDEMDMVAPQLVSFASKAEVEPPSLFGSPQLSFNTCNPSLRKQISFLLDESIDEQCVSPAFRVAAAC